MLRVLEHKFVGIRAEQGNATLKQYRPLEDQPIFGGLIVDQFVIVLEKRDRRAKQRPAIITGEVLQFALGHPWQLRGLLLGDFHTVHDVLR